MNIYGNFLYFFVLLFFNFFDFRCLIFLVFRCLERLPPLLFGEFSLTVKRLLRLPRLAGDVAMDVGSSGEGSPCGNSVVSSVGCGIDRDGLDGTIG